MGIRYIKKYQVLLAVAFFGVFAVGCITEVSTGLPIENIAMESVITANENGEVIVDGYLYHYQNNLKNKVKLDDKALFRAISGLDRQRMLLDDRLNIPGFEFLNIYRYTTTFASQFNKADAGTAFQIALTRPGAYGAPNSNVQMPAPPIIDLPNRFAYFSRSDSIDLRWQQGQMADGFILRIRAECMTNADGLDLDTSPLSEHIEALYSQSIKDPGIDIAKLEIDDNGDYSRTVHSLLDQYESVLEGYLGCFVTFTLDRETVGVIDDNFDPRSFIKAINRREVIVYIDLASVE